MNIFIFTQRTAARLLAVVAVFSLVVGMMPMQAFAGEKTFTATVSPTDVDVNTATPVTFTIMNTSVDVNGQDLIKSGNIAVPTGFSVSNLSISQTNWDVSLKDGGTRIEMSDGQGSPNPIEPGDSFMVEATVEYIGQETSAEWIVCVYHNESFNPGSGGDFLPGSNMTGSGCGIGVPVTINQPTPADIDLAVTKTVDDETPDEGQTVSYTITVTNLGADTASDITVTDTVPAGLTLDDADGGVVDGSTITWEVASLDGGDSVMFTVQATVDGSTGGQEIINRAEVWTDDGEENDSNNAAEESILVNEPIIDPVYGCTNPDANNFNAKADTDDGSCLYNLTITKVVTDISTTPDYTEFSFTLDGGSSIPFEADGTNVIEVGESLHTVVEDAHPDYTTTYFGCANIDVTANDAVCTITNTPANLTKYGTLEVVKVVEDNTTPYTDFSFQVDGDTAVVFEADGSNTFVVPVGAHTVVEVAATGYTTTYDNCTDVAVTEDATSTCTITNTWIPTCDDGIQNQDETGVDTGGVCGGGGNGPDLCTVEIVSDDTAYVVEKDASAQLLTFIHDNWDAVIDGASWIWGDDPVVDSSIEETQTFQNTFGFIGDVTSATLYVASDNAHSATVNSNPSHDGGSTFVAGTSYDVTSEILQGNNELSIAVTNAAGSADPQSNPAGVKYKLVIEGEVTTDDDCSVPYEEPVETYLLEGYVWNDENENDEWDGMDLYFEEGEGEFESPLSTWVITATKGDYSTTTETDEDGYYSFNLPAGTWIITETVKEEWSQTFPNSGSHEVTLPAPELTIEESDSFFAVVMDYVVPTAHAQTAPVTTYYNFGNVFVGSPVVTTSGGGGGSSSPRCDLFEASRDGAEVTLAWETRRGSSMVITQDGTEIFSTDDDDEVDEGEHTFFEIRSAEFELTVSRGSRDRSCTAEIPAYLAPTPQVLGEQVSVVPVGAPDTGAGGTSPIQIPSVQMISAILLRDQARVK